jgi:hypothetical protein
VLISCIWLIGYGLIVVVEAFRLRSLRHPVDLTEPSGLS